MGWSVLMRGFTFLLSFDKVPLVRLEFFPVQLDIDETDVQSGPFLNTLTYIFPILYTVRSESRTKGVAKTTAVIFTHKQPMFPIM